MRYIGAHVSASGGLHLAAKRAADLGCNTMQIFTGSPRIWKSKAADAFDYEALREAASKHGILMSVIHATYLINLASDNPELVAKSRAALVNDLNVASRGKFVGVVVHLGSHQGRGYEASKLQLATEIRKIIDESESDGIFLIENSAGQKGKIASDLSEIRELLDMVDSPRLGWCMDTCHAHANGYKLGNSNTQIRDSKQNDLFKSEIISGKSVVDEIERLNLWGSLQCIHVNDSRDAFSSGRDRHANLGEGLISPSDMQEFLNDSRITDKPLILEVPGFDDKGPDKKNVEILKEWTSRRS